MRGGGWGRAWVVVARGDEGGVAAKGAVRFTPGTVFKGDALVVPKRGQGRGRPAGGRVRGRGGPPPAGAEAQGGGRGGVRVLRGVGGRGVFVAGARLVFYIYSCVSFVSSSGSSSHHADAAV